MSGPADYVASNISPPRAGAVQYITTSTTATTTPIDADLLGKYITVKAIDQICDILIGGSAVVVSAAATSGDTVGWQLAAGESVSFLLTQADTHIAWDAAGAGHLRLWASSPPAHAV